MIFDEDISTSVCPKTIGTVKIMPFSYVEKGATIGDGTDIGAFCYIASKAVIGECVHIASHNNILSGVEVGDGSYIAQGVTFTNQRDPSEERRCLDRTVIGRNVTINVGCTILAPCMIGDSAIISAGSIILRNISDGERVKGIVK